MLNKIKRGNEKITDFSQLSYRLKMGKVTFALQTWFLGSEDFFIKENYLFCGFQNVFYNLYTF